jgi:hypothetical protein
MIKKIPQGPQGLKQAAEKRRTASEDRTLSGFYETAVEFKGIFMFLHS